MKSVLLLAIAGFLTLGASAQQDKSKRPSPPAPVLTQTITGGTIVVIEYSVPSVKGRTIGKDLDPIPGKVWRAGANEATTFQVDKNVKVEGKDLPAGKYSLFMIDNGANWTIIFNKNANIWGTQYEQNKSADALQVTVPAGKSSSFAEKLAYTISKDGTVTLVWGDKKVDFHVK